MKNYQSHREVIIRSGQTKIEWSSSSLYDHQLMSHGHVKSYTCSFCKRGFSNAQALGGHMNIHRKDKARLKESSSELLDYYSSTEQKGCSPEMTTLLLNRSREDDGDDAIEKKMESVGEWLQLPSFADKSRVLTHTTTKKKVKLSRSASRTDLDLELRLGLRPVPPETQLLPPPSVTKKLF